MFLSKQDAITILGHSLSFSCTMQCRNFEDLMVSTYITGKVLICSTIHLRLLTLLSLHIPMGYYAMLCHQLANLLPILQVRALLRHCLHEAELRTSKYLEELLCYLLQLNATLQNSHSSLAFK